MTYEALLEEADSHQLIVKEKPLKQHNGLIVGRKIAIREDMDTSAEKACVLAEELGHHYTTVGNILDQSITSNRKQERQARLWAYRKAFDLADLISAFKSGCRNRYEIAEYIGITESFLQDAINAYKEKYGICTKVDNYIVYFDPVCILELF